jgi:hypothetical protein
MMALDLIVACVLYIDIDVDIYLAFHYHSELAANSLTAAPVTMISV